MLRRFLIASLAFAVAYAFPTSVDAQRANMSDATGATVGLFSRVVTQVFAAPPAPPPTLVVSPEIMDALCVERADAMLVYASLSDEATDEPKRNAIALLRGGTHAVAAAELIREALVTGGAGSAEAEDLVSALSGLLTPTDPELPDVARAVSSYNELVESAPYTFVAHPPAEFLALRHALGRLTAAANTTFSSERVYPDLPPSEVRYANWAYWQVTGLPIQLLDEGYVQFGDLVEIGDRRFHRVAEYDGVPVLSEVTDEAPPAKVYVPLRGYCDIALQPYARADPVIKRLVPFR